MYVRTYVAHPCIPGTGTGTGTDMDRKRCALISLINTRYHPISSPALYRLGILTSEAPHVC